MSDLLYLDTARLGRVSPGAAAALRDFVALGSDEGAGLYFDRFLTGGLENCPESFTSRYPGLISWHGVSGLKASIRSLLRLDTHQPVLLASRSTSLMKLAARFLFHPCRNVLTTDLDWSPYAAILAEEAKQAGRLITQVPVREDVLAGTTSGTGKLNADELVELLCDRYTRNNCDGLYLTAVSNLGVRMPVEQLVTRLEETRTLRAVVVDGAQEFCHVHPPTAARYADLYLAGCHKWLGGYHPLGFAVLNRSRRRIGSVLDWAFSERQLTDPLVRFTSQLEWRSRGLILETVNLAALFAASGAVADQLQRGPRFRTRLENLNAAVETVSEAGWTPLLPTRELRSGILLIRPESGTLSVRDPELLREKLREEGVAATVYGGGVVRLSMPADRWQPGELDQLRVALVRTAESQRRVPLPISS